MTHTEKLFITAFIVTIISSGLLLWLHNTQPPGRLILTMYGSYQQELVDDLEVHISAIELKSTDKDWITVSNPDKTVSLNTTGQDQIPILLDDVHVEPGMYENVRLQISSVTAMQGGSERDVPLPNHEPTLPVRVHITNDKVSSLELRIMTSSISRHGNDGTYVWTPRIRAESRSGVAISQQQNDISVSGGELITLTDLYQDAAGETRYTHRKQSASSTLSTSND